MKKKKKFQRIQRRNFLFNKFTRKKIDLYRINLFNKFAMDPLIRK